MTSRKDKGLDNSGFSVIAPGAVLDGSIETDGDLLVHGEVRGTVVARLLDIGPEGTIEGEVTCRDVRVSGNLRASAQVDTAKITAHGRVAGDLSHLSLEVENGGFFHGRSLRRDLGGNLPDETSARSIAPPAPSAPVGEPQT